MGATHPACSILNKGTAPNTPLQHPITMLKPVTLSASIVVSMIALTALPQLQAAPLTIVENGTGLAVIVVEAKQPKAMKAGQALQTYIEKMSGAQLALIEEGAAVEGDPVRLLVGQTEAARKAGVKIPSGYDTTIRPDIFEEEGYALKTVGRSIVIGGNNDGHYKGTLYAAYALLERLGCRWYFPDEWGEVVPEQKTITVPELDVVSRPDFAVRSVNPSGWVPMPGNERELYTEWGEKNGFNFHRFYPITGDGLIGYLAPPLEYFETHPEFFAMNEQGERYHSEQPRVTMLCLSSPGLYAESVKNLRAAFAGEKKMPIPMIPPTTTHAMSNAFSVVVGRPSEGSALMQVFGQIENLRVVTQVRAQPLHALAIAIQHVDPALIVASEGDRIHYIIGGGRGSEELPADVEVPQARIIALVDDQDRPVVQRLHGDRSTHP